MRTGREPTGTSLTSFSSNISDSLAISLTSSGTVLACRFVLPAAQPRQPGLVFDLDGNNDYGDVVDAAILIGELNQFVRGALRIRLRLQSSGNFEFGNHARQSIRAKKQSIARKKTHLFHVDFNFRLCAEGAEQNALQIALFGFACGKKAAADLFRDQRMIAGELLK